MTDPVARGQGTADFWRAACSEFPNDNPDLHSGAVWICPAPRARPRAVVRAPSDAPTGSARAGRERSGLELEFLNDEQPTLDAALEELEEEVEVDAEALVQDDLSLKDDALPRESGVEVDVEAPVQVVSGEQLGHCAEALDALLWRSQLETQDPFLTELAQLLANREEAPLGIFGVAAAENSACAESMADIQPERAAYESSEPLEPLTLEGFVTGEVLPLSPAPQRVQALNALVLQNEIESLSSGEQAWDTLVQSLVSFLMARGATHAAVVVPGLVSGRAVNITRLPRAAQHCLIAEDFASEYDGVVLVRPEFRAKARRLYESYRAGQLETEALQRFVSSVMRALLATALDSAQLLDELRAAGAELTVRAA